MKKLLLLAAIFAAVSLEAQEIPFNGLIINASGDGIKARIAIKQTGSYTIANKQGEFGLTNITPKDTLVITFKRDKAEIPIGDLHSIKIVWNDGQPSYSSCTEIEEKGMGYVKRRELEAVSTGLTGDVMVKRGFTDLTEALLSMAPSLYLLDGRLAIRAEWSSNSTKGALLICNGGEISNASTIHVEEVESVQILKSPNIYGLRGSNGVIIITTKKTNGNTTGYPGKIPSEN